MVLRFAVRLRLSRLLVTNQNITHADFFLPTHYLHRDTLKLEDRLSPRACEDH